MIRRWSRRRHTLASQILLGVLAILFVTVALAAVVFVQLSSRSLDEQYQQRAVGIANAVAQMSDVHQALADGDPHRIVQAAAERIRRSSGASYVVVSDRAGRRLSHPNPALIGLRLEEPVAVLDGRDHVGIDHGSLGRSANGKAPVTDAAGRVIGQVSVGIAETQVASRERREAWLIAVFCLVVLLFGGAASWFMARRIKRATFGLELSELASLLQEREAMLYGIREGVIGVDGRGRISVLNMEAQRLLRLSPDAIGDPLDEVIPAGRLRDVLTGRHRGNDEPVLTDDALLLLNRMPVSVAGHDVGAVVTIRDRTELEALIRELRAISPLTEALRAQEHEYANRLHIMRGLLELEEVDEARRFLEQITDGPMIVADDIRTRIEPAPLAALIIAKITVAHEQNVDVVVSPRSRVHADTEYVNEVLTIVGNLIDNAVEALAGRPSPRRIEIELRDDDGLSIVVSDNGPGVQPADAERVFVDGYTTKASSRVGRRGVGLALISRIVQRLGGTIELNPGPGARFTVLLPARVAP